MTAKMRPIMEKGRWTDKRDTPQAALAPCRSDFLLIFARSAQKCGVCTPQNPTGRTAGFSRRSFPCTTKSHSLRNDFCFGGDKRDRTADLMTASHALSQLSYTPIGGIILSDLFGKCKCFFLKSEKFSNGVMGGRLFRAAGRCGLLRKRGYRARKRRLRSR